MSLIYGIKTQIGAYLAADTRLTTTMSSGLIKVEDDFGKYHSFGNFMHLVAAGDANLASFLIQKIHSSELRDLPYLKFKAQIHDFVKNEIGFYPYISDARNVVFIFSGCDLSKKEEVNMDKVVEYTRLMQGKNNQPVKQSISKPLLDAMVLAAVRGEKRQILELDSPYTGLFSLEIKFNEDLIIGQPHEAQWGSYLMYGPNGLTTEDAPKELVLDIDIGSKPEGLKGQDIVYYNSLKLIEFFVYKMIPEHQLHTVGGSVITFWITKYGALFPTGEVAKKQFDGSVLRNVNNIVVRDGKISTKIGANFQPLRELIAFYKPGGQKSQANI